MEHNNGHVTYGNLDILWDDYNSSPARQMPDDVHDFWAGGHHDPHMASIQRQMVHNARLANHNARRMAHNARLTGHQAAAMMGPVDSYQQFYGNQLWIDSSNMATPKRTEPRPRLTKDEVQILERVFAKTPKPTTSNKRELAEKLILSLARINNWFQNRRAKEKAKKRATEFSAQQERERAASESRSPEAEIDPGMVSEYYALGDHHRRAGPCSAVITDDQEGMPEDAEDSELDEALSQQDELDGFSDLVCGLEVSSGHPETLGDGSTCAEDAQDLAMHRSTRGICEVPMVSAYELDGPTDECVQADSQPSQSALRFKPPPPPTDIASRRKIRRPPSLGIGSLPNHSPSDTPEATAETSRRIDAANPQWRSDSTSSTLGHRMQNVGSAPGSPPSVDHGDFSGLASVQESFDDTSSALSTKAPEQHGLMLNGAPPNVLEERQGCFLGPFDAVYFNKSDQAAGGHSPRSPALPFNPPYDAPSSGRWDQSFAIASPLPTPSLSSQGGSEVEFSIGQQLPGYAVSQPATPLYDASMSFVGPGYALLRNGVPNQEYTFPGSFPGSSAMSSPGHQKPTQFQFAQNVTPQDFFGDK